MKAPEAAVSPRPAPPHPTSPRLTPPHPRYGREGPGSAPQTAQIAQDATHGKVLQMTSCVGGGDAFSAAAVMCTRAFPCSVCRILWGGTIILCVVIQLSNNVYTGNILVNSICPYKVWSAPRLKWSV